MAIESPLYTGRFIAITGTRFGDYAPPYFYDLILKLLKPKPKRRAEERGQECAGEVGLR